MTQKVTRYVDYFQAVNGYPPLWFKANSSLGISPLPNQLSSSEDANCEVKLVLHGGGQPRDLKVFARADPTVRGIAEVCRIGASTDYRGPQ